ncbi:MAG: hypothetical protein FJ109_04410 [Deltaproteobacteria bacterium]|nr:hypothetical protein [Deltaproteobacteria bacterium]
MAAGGFLVYVFFYKAPDERVLPMVGPADDALVQRRTERFTWVDDGSPAWRFVLSDGRGDVLFEQVVRSPEATVPYGILAPSAAYVWTVFSANVAGGRIGDPVVRARFHTAGELTVDTWLGSLTLFPDRVSIGTQEMVDDIVVEVSYPGLFRVVLPDELVFQDGSRIYDGSGTVLLYMRFDQAAAHEDPADWASIQVWAGGVQAHLSVGTDARPGHRLLASAYTGFDPFSDTPSFSNFERSLFSRLTRGTCVGIAMAVKVFFEHVRFGIRTGDDVPSAESLARHLARRKKLDLAQASLRALSENHPEPVMAVMSALHYENLDPQVVTQTIRAVLSPQTGEAVSANLFSQLRGGRLPVLGGFRLKSRVLKIFARIGTYTMLDAGHAFLVYRGWRFEDCDVFAVYDPNFEYDPGLRWRTVLQIPRGSRPVYIAGPDPDPDMVRFLPMEPDLTSLVVSLSGEGVRERLDDAFEAFEELWRTTRRQ